MSKFNKLYAEILLECCCNNDPDGFCNLLLTKLLPTQIDKINQLKAAEDAIEDDNYDELNNEVYNLSQSDPMIYIILTDDLVDIKDRDKYINNINNSEDYPDDLKCLASEVFNNVVAEDAGGEGGCCDVGGGDLGVVGELGCPPPHFGDKFEHHGMLPMHKVKLFPKRPQIFPTLGMYANFYNKKINKRKRIKK